MHRRLTERRFFAALRLPDLRRRLSRHAAMGLSDSQGGRRAVCDLCADKLSGSARRIVVAGARSGDCAQRPRRSRDRRPRPQVRLRARLAEKRALFDELYWWLRSRPTEAELREIVRNLAAFYHVDIAAFCSELCMSWQRTRRACGRSAGHHRRAYRQSSDAGEAAGRTIARSEMDLSRSVIEAALAMRPRASVLSVRRPHLGRRRANSRSPPNSASRRR